MKVLLIPLFTLITGYLYLNVSPADPAAHTSAVIHNDTTTFDQSAALEELRRKIEGREEEPSSDVYENIKMFGQLPAGRLLRVMEMGYSRSLGVTCTHCHNPKDWGSDEKKEKLITREMAAMTGKINREILPSISELGDRNAVVNCTTCHRGDTKPALNLDQ
ncbi:c-type cytochrome [Balneola sp. MJW-20]|uniref:c-type cytochrome n=1 Tax=Gracilimonas aurantiaca TaxID=3234185 RepID=UPI0034661544